MTGREVHVVTSVGQNFKQLLDDQSAIFGKKRKLKNIASSHSLVWATGDQYEISGDEVR